MQYIKFCYFIISLKNAIINLIRKLNLSIIILNIDEIFLIKQ